MPSAIKNGRQCLALVFALKYVNGAAGFNCPRHFISFTVQKFRREQIAFHDGESFCDLVSTGKTRRHFNNKNVHATWISSHKNNDSDESVRLEENEEQQLYQKAQQSSSIPPPADIERLMQMMGTSPRRVFLSFAASTAIALIANFVGITSNILSQLPEEFCEKFGLDYVYPRNGFKRVIARSSLGTGDVGKCSFLIPKEWVADTGLALAQAKRQAKALDLSMNSNARAGVLPDAAFGPPWRLDDQGLSNGDTNVSVIINSGVKNFSLKESLGEPTAAAELLISSKFRRPTTLLSAIEDQREQAPVYKFEYIVDRGEKIPSLRAISVIAEGTGGNSYITLTVVSQSPEWDKPAVDQKLRKIVNSLKLL